MGIEGRWFMTLMWFDEFDKEMAEPRNKNCCGYFATADEAEKKLKENWVSLWEHWCNTAVIDFVPQGFQQGRNPRQVKKENPRRWFKIKAGSDMSDGENLEPIEEPRAFKSIAWIIF